MSEHLPKPGEIRVFDGQRCRFIERELEGDKWEVLGPAEPPQDARGVSEEWRDCPSFPGLQASSFGRVKYVSGKIASRSPDKEGYTRAQWGKRGAIRSKYHHTLVADAFIGPAPPYHEVDHIDGDRSNNRPSNLRYLTHDENVKASAAAGRSMRGEKHVSAALTEEQAIQILSEYQPPSKRGQGVKSPCGLKALGKKYGVDSGTIHKLVKGVTWKHLHRQKEDAQ